MLTAFRVPIRWLSLTSLLACTACELGLSPGHGSDETPEATQNYPGNALGHDTGNAGANKQQSANPGPDENNEEDAEAGVAFDFDCIRIDRVSRPEIRPPAGLRLEFRVLDCNGDPIERLDLADVRVINDAKGKIFGDGFEGGSVSDLGRPTNYELTTVLALDLSDSIILSGALPQLLDGAGKFLDQLENQAADEIVHEVALMVFGRPGSHRVVRDFTADFDTLRADLEALRQAESLGSTDLYGAYQTAFEVMDAHSSCGVELSERFIVLMSDGTHEAGDGENQRADALDVLEAHPDYHVYAIGIDGKYDETKLAELASTAENFIHVEQAQDLRRAFAEVGYRIDAVADSNYVVGVCTPVSLGDDASLTISITTAGTDGSEPADAVSLSYPVDRLNGDVGQCDARAIAQDAGEPSDDDASVGTCECTIDADGRRVVSATVRDMRQSHPDFENYVGTDRNIVEFELGGDGKPVYAGQPTTPTTSGASNFDQWYNDVEGINTAIPIGLALARNSEGLWEFDDSSFFPIDGQGFGNEGHPHNYHFTLETTMNFAYNGGEIVEFRGDDDVWVFINGHLALDLGGVHGAQAASVDLDAQAQALGISLGGKYELKLFFAERHLVESNFRFQTSLDLACD